MDKPAVYSYGKAERRIKELKQELESQKELTRQIFMELLPMDSYWHEDEHGVWCDNCEMFFYYDENLKEMEQLFKYCPECGCFMKNYKGGTV